MTAFAVVAGATRNIGDHIQTRAAAALLPRVDLVAPRDDLAGFRPEGPVKLLCNGWFGTAPQNFVLPAAVDVFVLSVHLSERVAPGPEGAGVALGALLGDVEPMRERLRRTGPVGARDLPTLRLLERLQVPAYFSGCLTLTLAPIAEVVPSGAIVLCDVPADVEAHIRRITRRPVVAVSHEGSPGIARPGALDAALAEADQRLRLYQGAHLVVTSRLHCALPCLALGTPVRLLHPVREAERFEGLAELVHVLPPAPLGSLTVDLMEAPGPNLTAHLAIAERLRAEVAAFVARPSPARDPQREGALDLAATRGLLLALARRLGACRREADEAKAALASIEASTSWRVTAPLREMADRLRR
jgi:hypothetical protein